MTTLHQAIALHQAGDLNAAEGLYREILAGEPEQADALHLLGLVQYARGDGITAVELIRRAIASAPGNAVYHFNLGNVCRDLDDPGAAIQAYEAAIELQPEEVDYHYNLAELLDAQGQGDAALVHYRSAMALEPGHAALRLDLGACLQGLGQLDEAVAEYRAALELVPGLAQAHNNLGGIHQARDELAAAADCYRAALEADPELAEAHRNHAAVLEATGQAEAALHHYGEALRLKPDYAEVAYKLAALRGEAAPEAAPPEYVAQLFDQYAEDFDAHLGGALGYRIPERLRELFDELATGVTGPRVLDLGCGTGLSGLTFRDRAAWLAGVDLSPRMLDKARARELYDTLHCGDVVPALEAESDAWELILAADVFVYLGDLAAVMAAAARALRPGGWLLFSVEQGDQADFVLGKAGRYGHSVDYLRRLADAAGLSVRAVRATVLRQDFGQDVQGWLLALQKTE
ncbi:MAG: tetratricopeptide repeat protein [Xanthomonadaceae bacterium]|nr:tetratricopeptide repeat protein [Xanthomonadaceae bacterium]